MIPYWIEGHDSGGCFWIMPVKQRSEDEDWEKSDWGCYCCYDDEISIDDFIVEEFLYKQYLKKYFDKTIKYTCRERDTDEILFDWWGYNLYTYESVKKMALEMKSDYEKQEKSELSEFYVTLADRLLLMMERQPNWEFITFEGP